MTNRLQFANNAISRLMAPIDTLTTTLNVDPATWGLFPFLDGASVRIFKLTVEDRRTVPVSREIMHCWRSQWPNVFRVLRGQEGTVPLAFESGAFVSNRFTAGTLYEIIADFEALYLGAFAEPPSETPSGLPLAVGMLYWNSTLHVMMVWDYPPINLQLPPDQQLPMQWNPIVTPVPGAMGEFTFVATEGQTVFGGVDRDGRAVIVEPALQSCTVYLNGMKLIWPDDYALGVDQVTLAMGVPVGSLVQLITFGDPSAQIVPRVQNKLFTNQWVFDGVTTDFLLQDNIGMPIELSAATDLFISLDGVWIEALVDYQLVGVSVLRFTTPPRADAHVFGVTAVPTATAATVAQLAQEVTSLNAQVRQLRTRR